MKIEHKLTIPKIEQKEHETVGLLENVDDKSIDEESISSKIKQEEIVKNRKAEFEELEARIDKKLNELKNLEMKGRSEAGIIPKPIDPEQLRKDRANKFLEKTGLRIK